MVAGKERHGYPLMVNMQAAKNRPDRVTEITEILVVGGMLTSQPISLQTVSPDALEMVERANIKESTYVSLQLKLHEKKISSYTELIWPLPGETLESFRAGIGKLCRTGTDAVVTYPQLLLRNTPMERQREALGIETIRVADDASEADVVVSTNWVDRSDYEAGLWFYYAVVSLYNARGAYYTAAYLDSVGACDHVELLTAAADWFREHTDSPLCRFFADSIATQDNYDINNVGKVLHMVLHSHRAETDQLLLEFFSSTPWWDDPVTRTMLEIDLLARPYIYREAVVAPAVELQDVTIVEQDRFQLTVDLPGVVRKHLAGVFPAHPGEHSESTDADDREDDRIVVRLDHRGRRKMPYPRHRSLEHNASYCQAMMNRLQDVLPQWGIALLAAETAG